VPLKVAFIKRSMFVLPVFDANSFGAICFDKRKTFLKINVIYCILTLLYKVNLKGIFSKIHQLLFLELFLH